MRITDQYFWNFIFALFFIALVVTGTAALDSSTTKNFATLNIVDYVLITLASWRLIQLFVCDSATKFIREQFYDATKVKGGVILEKPTRGPRRTLANIFSNQWYFGLWATMIVVFSYMIFSWAVFPVVLLALSAVASFLQLVSNFVSYKTEKTGNHVDNHY